MIEYIKGDLFSHQTASRIRILAHACNCKGSWGAGVALAFKQKLPSTYLLHEIYCREHSGLPSPLLGTTQLILSEESVSSLGDTKLPTHSMVACLFTSDFAGRGKLPPQEIVHYTRLAIKDLQAQLEQRSDIDQFERGPNGEYVLNMPKINAGLFAVPWKHTESILKEFDSFLFNVYVLD